MCRLSSENSVGLFELGVGIKDRCWNMKRHFFLAPTTRQKIEKIWFLWASFVKEEEQNKDTAWEMIWQNVRCQGLTPVQSSSLFKMGSLGAMDCHSFCSSTCLTVTWFTWWDGWGKGWSRGSRPGCSPVSSSPPLVVWDLRPEPEIRKDPQKKDSLDSQ